MSTTDDKIKEIENKLEYETRERKEVEKRFSARFEALSNMLKDDTGIYKDRLENLEKLKADLTSYVLKLITVVIGLLGLILTISFLSIKETPDGDFLWFCIAILGLLVFVFVSWFYLWIRKEKLFEFSDIQAYRLQKRIANYFALVIVIYLISIIIYSINKIYPKTTPIYFFIFLFAFGCLLLLFVLIKSYSNIQLTR